jgi:hypothetical protein
MTKTFLDFKENLYRPASQQGSITVMIAFLLPVMLLMVALIVDINQLIFTKIKLQNTVDACALSAAAVQAAGLNEIADLNNEMVKEYNTLSRILKSGTWRDRGQAMKACDFFYNGGSGVIDYIRRYQKQSNADYARQADTVARYVKDRNFPRSSLRVKKSGPLTTLNEVVKTQRFTYYTMPSDPEKSPPVPTLRWRKPGTPKFADYRDGQYSLPDYRTLPVPGIFVMPERVTKTSPTYVDYELSLPADNFLLADQIFGGFPPLKARAAAKPAGGHVNKGNPGYTAVLIK